MSLDMFPDAAIDYIINHQETPVTDEDRIILDEVPLVVEVNYYNAEDDECKPVSITAGDEPFILFQMRQDEGAIVLAVTASQVEGEEELIETLEVFFETMLEERAKRGLQQAVDGAVEEYFDEEQGRRHEDAEIRDLGGA